VTSHPELFDLSIAHMDCDAFYASVEKRDNPELRDKPVIIGGGTRGVVSTACYIARIKGVRSAMPMFQALKLCPEAVVVRGRMDVYVEVSRQIRAMMEDLTPTIEPLSLDEAFLDLTGTAPARAPPAILLARLVKRMKDELGITGSIGLSHNKFLAKMASDMDKPQGFSVIGRAETLDLLAPNRSASSGASARPAAIALAEVGIRTIADLRRWDRDDLIRRFGSQGMRLYHLARGEDARPRRPRPRDQKHLQRDHLLRGHRRSTSSTAISGGWPKSSPTAPRPRASPAAPSRSSSNAPTSARSPAASRCPTAPRPPTASTAPPARFTTGWTTPNPTA
jgi:DNA polymerase-4